MSSSTIQLDQLPATIRSYLTAHAAAQRIDAEHWIATNRLEGNFPGGMVDLDYRFAMDGDRISELVIA